MTALLRALSRKDAQRPWGCAGRTQERLVGASNEGAVAPIWLCTVGTIAPVLQGPIKLTPAVPTPINSLQGVATEKGKAPAGHHAGSSMGRCILAASQEPAELAALQGRR